MDPITQGFFFRAEPKLEIWSLIRGYSLINIYWYFLLCGKYSCDPLWCRIHTSRIYIVLRFRCGKNIFVFRGVGDEEKCVEGKGDIKMPFSRCDQTGGEKKRMSGRSAMQRDGAVRRKGTRQTRQKGDRLPCPVPYVAEVMFHDIHPDSDTCQPEVPALFPPHTHVHLEHFFAVAMGGWDRVEGKSKGCQR